MDWNEYFGRFKTSPEFPQCLACGGTNTKEHYFTQTWCVGGEDEITYVATYVNGTPSRAPASVTRPHGDRALVHPAAPQHARPPSQQVPRQARVGVRERVPGLPAVQLPVVPRP